MRVRSQSEKLGKVRGTVVVLVVSLTGAGMPQARASDILDAANMASCYSTCDDVITLVTTTTGKSIPGCDAKGTAGAYSASEADAAILQFSGNESLSQAQAWCAKHGDTNFQDLGLAITSDSPGDKAATAPDGQSCSIQLSEADVDDFGGGSYTAACEAVGRMKKACGTLANSQLFYQCLAFKMTAPQPSDSGKTTSCRYGQLQGLQWAQIALDAAAAASCTAACFDPTRASQTWCFYTGVAASAAEVVGALTWKANNDATQWVAGAGGAVGGGLVGALAQGNMAQGALGGSAGKANTALACASAVVYAALGVTRTIAVADLSKTAEKTCKSIQDLTGTGSGSSTGSTSGSSSGWSSGSSSGSGSSTSGSGGGTSGGSDKVAALQECINGGGDAASCAETAGFYGDAQAATAKDVALMKSAGTRIPPGTDLKSLMDSIQKNGFGNTLAAMGNGQSPEVAAALGSLGQAAEKGGTAFARDNGFAATSPVIASLSGGAKTGGGAASSNPFGNLFGGGNQAGGGVFGSKTLEFGGGATRDPAFADNIWPANSDKNLFQIVSSRIGKVTPRVADGKK